MIRLMIPSYYPIRYIPIAESFDLPTRPNSLAVGIKNKSHHDFWIIKCRTQTILAIVIGEAIKKIPHEIIDRHPNVPWKELAGMQDKMVHGYFQISPTIVWETSRHDLSPLAAVVKVLLQEYI
jgi:uncharacterized protein with HEPN domain